MQNIHSIATSVSQLVFHLLVARCHEDTLDSFRVSKRADLVVGSRARRGSRTELRLVVEVHVVCSPE